MTWSYSRLTCYEQCPYKFYLKYIDPVPTKEMFYSSFGSFFHEILAGLFSGQISKEEAEMEFINGFQTKVKGDRPDAKQSISRFRDGLEYIRSFAEPKEGVIDTEHFCRFNVDKYHFIGYIDAILSDGENILCLDHKSHNLKPRSKRKTPTKSDEELSSYLRQLYLYSKALFSEYGKYPSKLMFNCYRSGTIVSEPFSEEKLKESEMWAESVISKIFEEEDWNPNLEYFSCKNLCECNDSCEYYELMKGGD